jgi:hypothetical protein
LGCCAAGGEERPGQSAIDELIVRVTSEGFPVENLTRARKEEKRRGQRVETRD